MDVGFSCFDELVAKDRDIPRGLDADPHLIALNLDDGDPDIWTDHDRLQRFPTENEHPDLPGIPVSAGEPIDMSPSDCLLTIPLGFQGTRRQPNWMPVGALGIAGIGSSSRPLVRSRFPSRCGDARTRVARIAARRQYQRKSHETKIPSTPTKKSWTGMMTRSLPMACALLLATFIASHTRRPRLLSEGRSVQAPISISGKRSRSGSGRQPRIPPRDFRKLVPGFLPEAEWPRRLEKARAAGFAARYEAVWWAIENGLTREVAAEIRVLHSANPTHAPTARMVAALDKLEPCLHRPRIRAFPQGPGRLDGRRPGRSRALAPPADRRRGR